MPLLSASVVGVRDEPPCSSLLYFEGAGRDGEAIGVPTSSSARRSGLPKARRGTDMRTGPSQLRRVEEDMSGSSLLRFEGAERRRGSDGVVGGEQRTAGDEGRRGCAITPAPALRRHPECARRAIKLVAVFSESARRDGDASEMRAGAGQLKSAGQSTRDNVDPLSLVRLLSASALHSRKEPAKSSLLCSGGAGRDRELEEARGGGWQNQLGPAAGHKR